MLRPMSARSIRRCLFFDLAVANQNMPLHNFTFAQPTIAGLLTTLLPVAVQFALFLRWLHRRMREDEIVHACVRDIALTHLPPLSPTLQPIGQNQEFTPHESPVT